MNDRFLPAVIRFTSRRSRPTRPARASGAIRVLAHAVLTGLHDQGRGTRRVIRQSRAAPAAHYRNGCCQRIRRGPTIRNDRHTGASGQRLPGAGIEDVRIAHTVHDHELLRVARRRHGGVTKRQVTGRRPIRALDGGDGDPPAVRAGRHRHDDDVAAGGDQRAVNPATAQHRRRFVRGEPLRDAAQVQLHAGPKQPHRPAFLVQFQLLPPDQRPRGREPGRIGKRLPATRLTPEQAQGPRRRVERAVTCPGAICCAALRTRNRSSLTETGGPPDCRDTAISSLASR